MARSGERLGPWWPPATFGLVGLLVLVATGHVVLGASVIALAFAVAIVLRTRAPAGSGGGLVVRSAALDNTLCLAAAVNVFGAALMVGSHIPWQILGALDLALLGLLVVVIVADSRSARARDARRAGRPLT